VLYRFQSNSPGDFYGTTQGGGAGGYGTVFQLTPQGAERVLYSFKGGTDGAHPAAALIERNGASSTARRKAAAPVTGPSSPCRCRAFEEHRRLAKHVSRTGPTCGSRAGERRRIRQARGVGSC
jgi:uncharacterized repeat protein (TIGR03803 family)